MNMVVKEFIIPVGEENYTFRLDFNALRKFENQYGVEGISLFNDFLKGKNTYDCALKILCCACVEKNWEEQELSSALPFNFKVMRLIDDVTFALVDGLFSESESRETKNDKASQNPNT